MNDLQKYIRLRGITVHQIAEATGANYHSVQKTIKGSRMIHNAREPIARYLGVEEKQIFGTGSRRALKRLIAQEIDRRAESERERLRECYLREDSQRIAKHEQAINA